MFSNPGSKTKIGQAMGILLIPRFWLGSTKTVVEFLVLVRGIFFFYHLKPYLNGFILSHDSKFLGAPIWPHLASFGPVGPFGHVWPRKALFGPFWPRLTLFGPVWPCLAPFGTIWPCFAPLGPTKPCLVTLQFSSQGSLSYGFAKMSKILLFIWNTDLHQDNAGLLRYAQNCLVYLLMIWWTKKK